MFKKIFVVIFNIILVCISPSVSKGEGIMTITSPAFLPNAYIPKEYTCQGRNVNPELNISGIPDGAKSLVLIMDDPDAPGGTWVHWVVYNMPVIFKIEKGTVPGQQGYNDFGRVAWGGPCPPSGTHKYFFKAYALDTTLSFVQAPRKADVLKAMEGHILSQAELIGLYHKQ